jgi:hypothetical protein
MELAPIEIYPNPIAGNFHFQLTQNKPLQADGSTLSAVFTKSAVVRQNRMK